MISSAIFGGDTSSDYWLTRLLLQRGIAAIYAIGFLVAINQFAPLLGTRGLTPVPFFIANTKFTDSPSVFYAHYSDSFAKIVAWLGLACAIFAITGLSERFGTPVSMLVWACMWVAYLSIVNVGQVWYGFGWESLLLECGFLAIFLGARNTAPPVIVIWMYRWVLFRLMFGAGMIKWRGDSCWRDLTCLTFHYRTQPIPNPLSWYLDKLPVAINRLGVLFNHFAELVVPFGYFVPSVWVVRIAGIVTVLFQGSIIVSGNLSWLNWLTVVIALSCFDDGLLSRVLSFKPAALDPIATPHQVMLGALVLIVVVLSIKPAVNLFSSRQLMNASFEPLHLMNTYGAFGSVSRKRIEVILEGTTDSVVTPASTWKEYAFKAKPGSLSRRLPIVAPYHLRLDWLMWFIPLTPGRADTWCLALVARLLQNDASTLALMSDNPFANAPPVFIRATFYDYRFTTEQERRTTGNAWARSQVGEMMRPVSLDTPGFVSTLESAGWVR